MPTPPTGTRVLGIRGLGPVVRNLLCAATASGPFVKQVYIEWPGGRLSPDGYISPEPFFLTGRTSGNYVHVVSDKMTPAGIGLWVRKEQIVLPEEISG